MTFSEDFISDRPLGIDPLTAKLMHHVMLGWRRVRFFTRHIAGTWAPHAQTNMVPGLACAAHFLIVARATPADVDDQVAAGRAAQCFWLTATYLGLVLKPEITPINFARCAPKRRRYSAALGIHEEPAALATLVGDDALRDGVFMGRIGAGAPAASRSTWRRLDDVRVAHAPQERMQRSEPHATEP